MDLYFYIGKQGEKIMKKNFSKLLVLAIVAITITGCSKKEATEMADAGTTASIVNNGAALVKALSADGGWIAAALNDIVLEDAIVVAGKHMDGDDVVRKLGLYAQDADHNITAQYTLTAPKMIVQSPNFKLTGGTFKGDVYVEAAGFLLDKSATVDGDIYFMSQGIMDTFTMNDTAKILGEKIVVDAVSTASIVTEADALVKAVSPEGAWIAAVLNDIELTEELVVDGEFVSKEVTDRKLALYGQDANHTITDQYTVTAPKLIVKSPNFRITGGTFVGDVYVEADGFWLDKSATVDGDIYFSTQEQLDAFTMADTATLNGEKLVK